MHLLSGLVFAVSKPAHLFEGEIPHFRRVLKFLDGNISLCRSDAGIMQRADQPEEDAKPEQNRDCDLDKGAEEQHSATGEQAERLVVVLADGLEDGGHEPVGAVNGKAEQDGFRNRQETAQHGL